MKRVERLSQTAARQLREDIEAVGIEPSEAFPVVTDALTAMYKQALEDAARESESWWELFNSGDPVKHRAANPNQIAARIRSLADAEEEGRE